MYQHLFQTATRYKQAKERTMTIGPFTGGLVTSRPPERLGPKECSEMTNIVYDRNGLPRTRPGLTKVCSGVVGEIDHIEDVKVGGTAHTIISATDSTTYRLYKKNGTSVTQIGTDSSFDGPIYFTEFNDLLMIFDGGFVKYWDGTDISIAFDYGTGANNYYIKNSSGEYSANSSDPSYVPFTLNAALRTRAAVKFTTDAFGSGTMKPQGFTVKLSRIGNGHTAGHDTDYIKATVRLFASPYTVMASKDLVLPGDVPVNGNELYGDDFDSYQSYSSFFTDSEITTELSESTDYLFSIEYTYTDASNGIYVLGVKTTDTVHDEGYTWDGAEYDPWLYGSIYQSVPAFDVKSGMPPQLKYGVVNSSRIFAIEGDDGTNPTYVWYSGAGNHLDWSSPDSAGYFEAGRAIGGIASFYDNTWIFGTERQPTLSRLSGGTSPSNFSLSDSIQYIAGQQNSIIATPNDVVFLHSTGISSINTMQDFGDIRSNDRSANISDVIAASYDTSAVAGYEPSFGVYVIKFSDGGVYALHTRGGGRFPVSKWVFNLPEEDSTAQEVSAFGQGDGVMYVGTDQGVVYKMDIDVLTDDGNYPTYSIKSAYLEDRFNTRTGIVFSSGVTSFSGGQYNLVFYRDFSSTSLFSRTIQLPTVRTGTPPDSNASYLRGFDRDIINFDFIAVKIGYESIVPYQHNPVYFGETQLIVR